jgi:hypothetical protein
MPHEQVILTGPSKGEIGLSQRRSDYKTIGIGKPSEYKKNRGHPLFKNPVPIQQHYP